MKNNVLTIKDESGKKKEYRILFNIESTTNNKCYVVYTDDSKNKNDEIIVFASSYVLSSKGNMTKLKSITDKNEFNFISKILSSLVESEK
ncbi:MAG: DUF1292 domain-containing protein [Tenericutes bacterium]|nr:DUF1292 domain-containing protein [Mycoplasmatota bacterium]